MRIALMPSSYAPAIGGVEILTARLARQLTVQGHQVEVWAPRSEADDLPACEVIDGLTVRRFVFAMPRASPLAVLGWPRRAVHTLGALRAAVRQFRPALLHVQCFSGNGAYATMLSRITGLPLIVTLQGETVMDDGDIYDRSLCLRTALRAGLRQAAVVTGCSAFTLADAGRRFGLKRPKGQVIFNGVDDDETRPIAVPAPFGRYVVALGRVVPKKGFDLLIDAFARLADEQPALGLVIGGDGSALAALRRQAAALGLTDRVHFTGALNRGQVAGLLQRAEVLVMPSRLEPFGIVALEGWRAGIPVVVSNRGGAAEFVQDDVSGLVVDPTDPAGLAQAISRLTGSAELRGSLAETARRRLPVFFWQQITAEYLTAYQSATGRVA